jgi:phosphatidate cytidylyltransferase
MMTRLITGLSGLAFLLPAIIWGGAWVVEAIVWVAVFISLDEYTRMAFPRHQRETFAGLSMMSVLTLAPALRGAPELSLAALVIAGAVCMSWVLYLLPGVDDMAESPDLSRTGDLMGRLVLALVWIPGCLHFLVRLRDLEHGLGWVFTVLVISWMGDTGAYFAGRFFGNSKLYPIVSPKKTWAGVWGGIAGAIVGLLVQRGFNMEVLGIADCVFLGAIGCIAGITGDLSESLLKRSFGVKDSGWIMPGHGGLLDRIDSVMFVAPVVWVWAVFFEGASR